ncbi:helix-turn-helix domain-containing protein [Oscillatoria amoena NRMC-F 0135]|nr:helix-turn-helix domain-containing protein [Oscillatoria amoena NRMC-F 0135]
MDNTHFQQPNLITVKEAANYLRIPVPTVYYLVQRGQLPAVQIGGRWRIKKDEIDTQILGRGMPEGAANTSEKKNLHKITSSSAHRR